MSPTPWRVPQWWLVIGTTLLLTAWLHYGWPNWGLPVGLYGAACVLFGRHAEDQSRINRKLRAAIRPRPIVAARAATEYNLRRIPNAHLPELPQPRPR